MTKVGGLFTSRSSKKMPDAATIPVPAVINLTQSQAEETLKGVGLVVGAVETASSVTTPVGSVSSANPAPGTLVSPGSSVDLVLSSSSALERVTVPDVV